MRQFGYGKPVYRFRKLDIGLVEMHPWYSELEMNEPPNKDPFGISRSMGQEWLATEGQRLSLR